jgi:hypothetical protein
MASEHENTRALGARFTSFALFAAAFCLYAITSAPSIGWLDSPEFVAQAVSLGVAHSPGHPLPGMLGRLASLVPIGDLVWRVNLMSSLCAAGAVTLLFACARSLLANAAPSIPDQSRHALALIFAAMAALAWALWSNAVRAEVYALQALLSSGALLALLQYEVDKRPRHLLTASFLLALGLANHHLMTLTILVPAAVYVMTHKERPSLRLSGWVAGIGVVGLSTLAYLPIRSLAHPEVNFGAPHTLERFFWTLRGAAFSKSAHTEHVSPPLIDAIQILVALSDALTLPLLLLAFMGIIHVLRTPSVRRLGVLLISIAVVCCAVRVMLGFDPETPDHHAYLLPAIFALLLLAIVGVAQLCTLALAAQRPLPKAPALACVALALLVPIQGVANYEASNHADAWASDDLAHWEMDNLPPHSLVLVSYFQTTFRQWALHAVEGTRPDVAILDRSFLTYPGMEEESKLRWPQLAGLIDAPLRAGAQSPTQKLAEIARHRPLFVQLHINVGPGLAAAVSPSGAYASWTATGSAPDFEALDKRDLMARQALAARFRHSSAAESTDAKQALLWHDAMRLDQYCQMRRLGPATRVYADARALAPGDIMLREMAKACGIPQAQ